MSKSAVLAAALFFFAACAPDIACSRAAGPARIELNTATDRPTIDVIGLAPADLNKLGEIQAARHVDRHSPHLGRRW